MPLLSIAEAALRVGYSIELLKYLTKHCPKHGETRVLAAKNVDGQIWIEEGDLLGYQRYLNDKWPIPNGHTRPPMREAIAEDVKAESHYECAICGKGNHGELAHINAVAGSACNGPDNLLYLCPNHHTAYDYGFKVSSNVTPEVIHAAKALKRESRRRMLRYEANAAKAMFGLIQQIKKLEEKLAKEDNADLKQVNVTEMKVLMSQVSVASNSAKAKAAQDVDCTKAEIELSKLAPKIAILAAGGTKGTSEKRLRMAAADVVAASKKVILDLGETECPHCAGSGQRGLLGSLCSYCGGSCYVSTEVAKEYDPNEIDEVDCPRCGGRGQTGLVGDLCAYCKGDGFVTKDAAEDYDPSETGEVNCPRCAGKGQVGLVGTLCSMCKGSCFVRAKAAEDFDSNKLDEVDCPRCGGRGQTGLVGDLCAYCKGDGFVTKDAAENYDPSETGEVDCPRCGGKGQVGLVGTLCSVCKGSCFIHARCAAAYNPNQLQEEDCPRCSGSGQTGLVGDLCALCKGDCVVSPETADAYRRKYS